MASRSSSISGSDTVSQRMSSLPCQTRAFIAFSGWVELARPLSDREPQQNAFVPIFAGFLRRRPGRGPWNVSSVSRCRAGLNRSVSGKDGKAGSHERTHAVQDELFHFVLSQFHFASI